MYKIGDVLSTIDHNHWVWVFTGIGWVFGSIQFLEGIRLGYRNKMIGLPLGYLVAVFAHDSAYALNYDLWFHKVHHWYFTTFWYFYPFWVCVELACIIWFTKLAYREFKPAVPERLYFVIVGSFVATAVVLFHLLGSVIDDPLHIFGLAVSQVVNVVFMIPMIVRRGGTRGTSRLLGWSILLGPGSLGLLQSPAMVPALRTGWFYAMVVCMAALSVGYLLLFEYYRKREAANPLATMTTQSATALA